MKTHLLRLSPLWLLLFWVTLSRGSFTSKDDGAPWTISSRQSEIALIISTNRGASTEIAEHIGNHPCAVSFNEWFESKSRKPGGYSKYKEPIFGFLSPQTLDLESPLNSTLAARASFCDSRPQQVKDVCGDVCTVAFKVHVNAQNEPWMQLLPYNGTFAIIVERNATENFCSLQYAQKEKDFGHTPADQKIPKEERPPCNLLASLNKGIKNEANFEKLVTNRRKRARKELFSLDKPSLEIPFSYYVKDTAVASERILNFLGLSKPPAKWNSTCPYPWCRNYSWPAPAPAAAAVAAEEEEK